jgi:DNA transposition AAA+ family ATPase
MNDPRQEQIANAPDRSLIDRERIRGASRMIPEGTEASAVTPDQIEAVAADVMLFTTQWKVHLKDVAKAVGYSAGVVSEFCKGTYRGNLAQVAIDLDGWLREEEQRRRRPETTRFVRTNLYEEMKSTASFCLDRKKIGLVYSPDSAGVGKTTALKAILQDLGPRRASLATIDKVDANPTGLLKKLCQSLRVADHGTNARRFERLVAKLEGRAHLVMIDQIHNLRHAKDDKPFYILTDLYDATGTAQLWCGTADLYTYLFKQQRRHADESLAQVRSRIFPVVDLLAGGAEGSGGAGDGVPVATVEQLRDAFAHNKLRLTDSAARFLARLCNMPDSGGMRICVQLVEYAFDVADLKNLKSVDVPLLKMAMRRGLIPDRVEELIAKADQAEVHRMAAAG